LDGFLNPFSFVKTVFPAVLPIREYDVHYWLSAFFIPMKKSTGSRD
jgi:hypothetical protein